MFAMALVLSLVALAPPAPPTRPPVTTTAQDDAMIKEVTALLQTQAAAWTRGDLPAFCAPYAEDARFVTTDGLTRGRAAILERYRKRYPDLAAMGTLTFEAVEVRELWGPEVSPLGDAEPGNVHALTVVARWKLERSGRPPASGTTLLVFRRDGGKWSIVEDASL